MEAELEQVSPTCDCTNHTYTQEQKTILTDILARELYAGFMENQPFEMTVAIIKIKLQEFPWFRPPGNLFPHLEACGIKGAYDFPIYKTTRFYIRICFPDKFQKWLFSFLFPKKPPLERYLELYLSDKIQFKKPSPEVLSGNWSVEKRGPRMKSLSWGK